MSVKHAPATPLPWTPSTHHDVPQPAGSQCAAWYEAVHPSACDILYALAHTKGERDKLVSALRPFCADPETAAHSGHAEDYDAARALLREIGESDV
ncbi:MAG: hypothetical protein Q8P46_15635 [Hyphomicrobiales bacterium]|nr:hypothetical protein [Hyphomicrobiales bacterium]